MVRMGDQNDSNHKTPPCSWCIQAHDQNQWLHSTLSELDRSTKEMQTLIGQEDGDAFAQQAETCYRRRPELLRKVADFRRSYHILAEYCGHLSIRSAGSGLSSFSPLESFQSTTNKSPSFSPSVGSNHESARTSTDFPDEDNGTRLTAAAACHEELSREMQRTVSELAKRNKEKREAKRELQARVVRLAEETDALQRRLREAAHENAALRAKLKWSTQGKMEEEDPRRNATGTSTPSIAAVKKSKLSRLKVVICQSCASGT